MDCREWNRTDKAQKTWVNFKVHFSRAFRENRDQSKQAQHAGYGQSNTQNSANAAMFAEMTQDNSHALGNLAKATQSDRDTVTNMSKKIADLTLQLGQANTKFAEAQSSIRNTHLKTSQNWSQIQLLPHKIKHSHVTIAEQRQTVISHSQQKHILCI